MYARHQPGNSARGALRAGASVPPGSREWGGGSASGASTSVTRRISLVSASREELRSERLAKSPDFVQFRRETPARKNIPEPGPLRVSMSELPPAPGVSPLLYHPIKLHGKPVALYRPQQAEVPGALPDLRRVFEERRSEGRPSYGDEKTQAAESTNAGLSISGEQGQTWTDKGRPNHWLGNTLIENERMNAWGEPEGRNLWGENNVATAAADKEAANNLLEKEVANNWGERESALLSQRLFQRLDHNNELSAVMLRGGEDWVHSQRELLSERNFLKELVVRLEDELKAKDCQIVSQRCLFERQIERLSAFNVELPETRVSPQPLSEFEKKRRVFEEIKAKVETIGPLMKGHAQGVTHEARQCQSNQPRVDSQTLPTTKIEEFEANKAQNTKLEPARLEGYAPESIKPPSFGTPKLVSDFGVQASGATREQSCQVSGSGVWTKEQDSDKCAFDKERLFAMRGDWVQESRSEQGPDIPAQSRDSGDCFTPIEENEGRSLRVEIEKLRKINEETSAPLWNRLGHQQTQANQYSDNDYREKVGGLTSNRHMGTGKSIKSIASSGNAGQSSKRSVSEYYEVDDRGTQTAAYVPEIEYRDLGVQTERERPPAVAESLVLGSLVLEQGPRTLKPALEIAKGFQFVRRSIEGERPKFLDPKCTRSTNEDPDWSVPSRPPRLSIVNTPGFSHLPVESKPSQAPSPGRFNMQIDSGREITLYSSKSVPFFTETHPALVQCALLAFETLRLDFLAKNTPKDNHSAGCKETQHDANVGNFRDSFREIHRETHIETRKDNSGSSRPHRSENALRSGSPPHQETARVSQGVSVSLFSENSIDQNLQMSSKVPAPRGQPLDGSGDKVALLEAQIRSLQIKQVNLEASHEEKAGLLAQIRQLKESNLKLSGALDQFRANVRGKRNLLLEELGECFRASEAFENELTQDFIEL